MPRSFNADVTSRAFTRESKYTRSCPAGSIRISNVLCSTVPFGPGCDATW